MIIVEHGIQTASDHNEHNEDRGHNPTGRTSHGASTIALNGSCAPGQFQARQNLTDRTGLTKDGHAQMRMTTSEFATGTQSIPPTPIGDVVTPTSIFRENDTPKEFSFLHPTGRNDHFQGHIAAVAAFVAVGGRRSSLHKKCKSLRQIRWRNHIDDRKFLVTHSSHVAQDRSDLFVYCEMQESSNRQISIYEFAIEK
jgi:hypothetical protein